MRIRALTVTEINNYLKRIITQDPILSHIQVRGEISNYKLHSSGHAYFSIKDTNSKLNCVMFNQSAAGLDFKPADGMSVIAKGRISIYERDGKYQLYVSGLENEGKGDLHVKFEKLKKELAEAGYFEESIKSKLPFLPKRIGVVTSPTGAAIRDILSVIKRRNTYPEVIVFPVRVQGETSSVEITTAIEFFNTKEDVDVIILSRGGGSIEELWSFNERNVAEAIFNSKIPVVSGVGHETDFTISDFVSDYRAPTPSAAAEIVVTDSGDLLHYLENIQIQMEKSLMQKVDLASSYLEQADPIMLKRSLDDTIMNYKQEADYLLDALTNNLDKVYAEKQNELNLLGKSLNILSPLNQLDKGYGIISEHNGKSISSLKKIKENDTLDIFMKDGKMIVIVEKRIKGASWVEKNK